MLPQLANAIFKSADQIQSLFYKESFREHVEFFLFGKEDGILF